jgi:voltage-gated potassium channel
MVNITKKENRREYLREVIFGAETPAGKLYDICLIGVVVLSVLVVMLGTVEPISTSHGSLLSVLEWIFTILFTVDYSLRIYCIGKPLKYVFSFFGIIDLLSVLPTYLSIFIPGTQYLATIRFLRILRIFRVLKLSTYQKESDLLLQALHASWRRITVFLFFVLTAVVAFGSLMYTIEGSASGFTSIPRSIYWAIVTLTTVGYGDISPQTGLGQTVAAMIMILGYSIIVIPTGIVAASMPHTNSGAKCTQCGNDCHDADAKFCKKCGKSLS